MSKLNNATNFTIVHFQDIQCEFGSHADSERSQLSHM